MRQIQGSVLTPSARDVDAESARRVPRGASAWLGYGGALAAVAISLLFRDLVRESLGVKVPYLQFYPPIILAASYGGLGPGVLATATSTLAAAYFFLAPEGLAVRDGSDQLSLAVFAGTGLVMPILKEIMARIEALDAMMKDLLLFARPPQPNYSPTEVVPLVASIASFMSQDPSASGVDVDIAGEAPPSRRTPRCFGSSSRTS
jgi:K+-sensing histidine kinase KdpD